MEKRSLILAWIVIVVTLGTVVVTVLERVHEGRCAPYGYGRRFSVQGGCGYPAHTWPTR